MLRRNFLLTFGQMALVAGLTSAEFTLPARGGEVAGAGVLQALFRNIEDAAELGRRYLRDFPHEANKERLLSTLSVALGASLLSCDRMVLRCAIRDLRARDFTDGDVVIVDGWILSRCEARLCALASMR